MISFRALSPLALIETFGVLLQADDGDSVDEEASNNRVAPKELTMAITKLSSESIKQAVVNAQQAETDFHDAELRNDVEIRHDSQQLKAQKHGKIHEEKADGDRDVITNITGRSIAGNKPSDGTVTWNQNTQDRAGVSYKMKTVNAGNAQNFTSSQASSLASHGPASLQNLWHAAAETQGMNRAASQAPQTSATPADAPRPGLRLVDPAPIENSSPAASVDVAPAETANASTVISDAGLIDTAYSIAPTAEATETSMDTSSQLSQETASYSNSTAGTRAGQLETSNASHAAADTYTAPTMETADPSSASPIDHSVIEAAPAVDITPAEVPAEPTLDASHMEHTPVVDASPVFEGAQPSEAAPSMGTEPIVDGALIDNAPSVDTAPVFESPPSSDAALVSHTPVIETPGNHGHH
jgi:hypothetical protein